MASFTIADEELARTDIVAYLKRHEQKELLRLVVIGSVDDGKSTLIGRLLHDTHGIYEDQLAAVKRASAKGATRGDGSKAEIDLSLLTDGLRAEREQGITIDVAYRYFSTATRKFIVADTPGHVQYTRNMATGASTAHLAVILVDARLGVLAQTRRHAFIASLLGLRHLCVCVNKMDLVAWDEARFRAIADEIGTFARQLGIPDVTCLPVSALRGDHVVDRGDAAPWYTGKTLLEHLEAVPIGDGEDAAALRYPVQLVLRPSVTYRGYASRVASGTIAPGDEILALPSGKQTRVVGVDAAGVAIDRAHAGMSVAIRLAEEIDLSRGDMLVDPKTIPHVGRDLDAMLVWMSERPLDRARSYLMKHTTRLVRAEVATITGVIAPETLAPTPADALALNDIARVVVRCHAPIFFDAYAQNRTTGAFVLIDSLTNDTVAAGMIRGPAAAGVTGEARRALPGEGRSPLLGAQVSDAERRERLGQRGHVIAVGTQAVAHLVERVLFDAGRVAAVVPAVAAASVASAGVDAIVVDAAITGARVVDVAIPSAADDEALAKSILAAVRTQETR